MIVGAVLSIIQFPMGSSFTQDQNVALHIFVKQIVCTAGDIINGIAYIDCRDQVHYRYFYLRLEGQQKVDWSVDNGQQSSTNYSNSRKSYESILPIKVFNNGISRGRYKFNFSILLPQSMPASFMYISKFHSIIYTLSACLSNSYDDSHPQHAYIELNIREPFRTETISRSLSSIVDYGGCCCDEGSVKLSLTVDNNIIVEQPFNVRAEISNLNGSQSINGYSIKLIELIKQIESGGSQNNSYGKPIVLFTTYQLINIGREAILEKVFKLPQDFVGYTAIGNIIYRAYFIQLEVFLGTFTLNRKIKQHVVIYSSRVAADKVPIMHQQIMDGFLIDEKVQVYSLPPYIYNPMPKIDVINRQMYIPPQFPSNENFSNHY